MLLTHDPKTFGHMLTRQQFDSRKDEFQRLIESHAPKTMLDAMRMGFVIGAAKSHEELSPQVEMLLEELRNVLRACDEEIVVLSEMHSDAGNDAMMAVARVRNPIATLFQKTTDAARETIAGILSRTYLIQKRDLLTQRDFSADEYMALGALNARHHPELFSGWVIGRDRIKQMKCTCTSCMTREFDPTNAHHRSRVNMILAVDQDGTTLRAFGEYIWDEAMTQVQRAGSVAKVDHGQVDPAAAEDHALDLINRARRGDNDANRGN